MPSMQNKSWVTQYLLQSQAYLSHEQFSKMMQTDSWVTLMLIFRTIPAFWDYSSALDSGPIVNWTQSLKMNKCKLRQVIIFSVNILKKYTKGNFTVNVLSNDFSSSYIQVHTHINIETHTLIIHTCLAFTKTGLTFWIQ